MWKCTKVLSTLFLILLSLGVIQGSAKKQVIQTSCSNSSSYDNIFHNDEECFTTKSNRKMSLKFLKINSECACAHNILEMLNQSVTETSSGTTTVSCPTNDLNIINANMLRLKYPGENCNQGTECLSGHCNKSLNTCTGQLKGEYCSNLEGVYCNLDLICDTANHICKQPHQVQIQIQKREQKNNMEVLSLHKNTDQVCSSSYQCKQNEFCHFGACLNLMSLQVNEEIDETENQLFRIGGSILDIRCQSLLVVDNKCIRIEESQKQGTKLETQKCSSSNQCPFNRQCTQIWDSSIKLFNKYNPFSSQYCQIYPNHNLQFINSVKTELLNQLLSQNSLCPLNIKLQSSCNLIGETLKQLQEVVYYIDNYHIINNSCLKDLTKQINPKVQKIINLLNSDEIISLQVEIERNLQSQPEPKPITETNNIGESSGQQGNNTDQTAIPEPTKQTEGDTTAKSDNTDNQNNNNDDKKEEPKTTESSDSGSSTTFIIIFIVLLLVFGCCGMVIYIRRRNENGFASLTAALENDKQLMMKKGGGMMSMGSHSIHNNKINGSSSDSSGNIQNKQKHGDEMQIVDSKKFSKRVVNEDSRLPSQQKEGTIPLKIQNHHSGGELHLEQNNGLEFSEKPQVTKHSNNRHHSNNSNNNHHQNGSNGNNNNNNQNNNNINTGNPTQQIQGAKAQGNSQSQQRQILTQQQDIEQQKNLDTSVQNNFFSIDGEDEEKHDKIMDSIQLDYQSDDTTYSNVFNLEGEESSKPHSNRKKKKKQKQQNHLFFDDKNEE